MKETRQALRVSLSIPVVSTVSENHVPGEEFRRGHVIQTTATDISLLGIGVFTRQHLPENLQLSLEIDGRPFGKSFSLVIQGVVRYCIFLHESVYRCGIKFTQLTPEAKQRISDYIGQISP